MATPLFHEVRFPLDISMKSRGGPQRRTDVVTLGSGREERNARWANSSRRYNAGYGVKSLAALADVLSFFEERRGMLYGFRWHDRLDFKSCAPDGTLAPADQLIGTGDGATSTFQLCKIYGGLYAPWTRDITKPVDGSVRVAVAGAEATAGSDFDVDASTGLVTFRAGHAPSSGSAVTAGYMFDVPVRFDTDFLEVDLAAFEAGQIPNIPLIEIRI